MGLTKDDLRLTIFTKLLQGVRKTKNTHKNTQCIINYLLFMNEHTELS